MIQFPESSKAGKERTRHISEGIIDDLPDLSYDEAGCQSANDEQEFGYEAKFEPSLRHACDCSHGRQTIETSLRPQIDARPW